MEFRPFLRLLNLHLVIGGFHVFCQDIFSRGALCGIAFLSRRFRLRDRFFLIRYGGLVGMLGDGDTAEDDVDVYKRQAYCFSFSIFTSHFLNKIGRCGSAGVWGASQDAFGYPNAMLAKPVTGWKRKNAADLEAAVLIRFFDFGKAVKGGADEISLFSGRCV